jgi:hypothetical protein
MGSIISAIGQVGGAIPNAIIGSHAAVNAGNEQQAGIQNAENTVQNTYNQNSAYYTPWIQNGTAANNQATQMASNGFTMSDFQKDPAAQFDYQNAINSINNAQSVRGGALSGGAQKAMSNYAQQNASNEYSNAYARFANQQSQLMNLSNQGLSATQGLGQLGSNYSAQMGNLQTGMGNSQASETLGKAGALESAFGPYGSGSQAAQGSSLSGLMGGLSSAFSSPTTSSGYTSSGAGNVTSGSQSLGAMSGADSTDLGATALVDASAIV